MESGSIKGVCFALVLSVLLVGCGVFKCTSNCIPSEGKRITLSDYRKISDSASIESLRLAGKLTITSADMSSSDVTSLVAGRTTVRLVVLTKMPNRLRMEILPLNGMISLAMLTATGSQATLIDFKEKQAIQGNLKRLLNRSFIGVGLDYPVFVALFSGRVTEELLQSLSNVDVYYTGRTDRYEIVSNVSRWEVDSTGRWYKVTLFDSWGGNKTLEAIQVNESPGNTIQITLPGKGERLKFVTEKVKLNTEVSDSLFTVRIPASFAVY